MVHSNRFSMGKSAWARRFAAAVAGVAVAAMAFGGVQTANAMAAEPATDVAASSATNPSGRHFMVYYRAWRDVTMKGVNTDLPDENWISMYDIPYGIDVVNVFSYVPSGQEEQAQPFYDTLKAEYAPYLHSRGIKLVRGIDYTGVVVDGFRDFMDEAGKSADEATEADYDAYAQAVLDEYMTSVGLDGLDIDMETRPDADDVEVSNNVIRALSKHIGPLSDNPEGTMFLYDTNGSNLDPFKDVADCFDYVAYQQYGSDATRTAKAAADYAPYIGNEFVPGLTFPEEGDMNNRWYDAREPYEDSHFYQVASYVNEHDLGGMFVYALDRDGRNYDEDLSRIVPSNLLWTKTAIAESQGMPLEQAKAAASHFLDRMALTQQVPQETRDAVAAATNLYEANKAVLGADYGQGFSNTYDPTLEAGLLDIDTAALKALIGEADAKLDESGLDATVAATLRDARDAAVAGLTGKVYTAGDVTGWTSALDAALAATEPSPVSKDALRQQVETIGREIDGLRQSDYTAESWNALQSAIESARAVLADDQATQEQVDQALERLVAARDGLAKADGQTPTDDDAVKPGKPSATDDKPLATTGSSMAVVAAAGAAAVIAGVGVLIWRRRKA